MLAQLPPALQNLQLPLRLRLWDGHEFNLGPEPSVTIVVKDPTVVSKLTHPTLDSLGEAFVEQPADVMNAVQVLRAEAQDKGNLVNTPQQTVVKITSPGVRRRVTTVQRSHAMLDSRPTGP